MVRVAPIKLQYNPKTLWFDPQEIDIHKGDPVVVKTARGTEFGHAAEDIIEVDDADIKKLKTELKPVVRIASPEDEAYAASMQVKSNEALPIFKEMAAEVSTDMHPVSVEYLLDGDKAVFYFEAEERVDFRELVRRLASYFRVRVDMRQIGVRDEARMVGGLGHCGQELCCKRMGGEFCPVSIRMAKEQDLSLNPQKISGVCGRLMCCLRYEYDAYKEFKSRAPKQNALIETPKGTAKVIDLDMPREVITLRLPEGKNVKIPLAEFTVPELGARPNAISAEVYETYTSNAMAELFSDAPIMTPNFTGTDRLADPSAKTAPRSKSRGSGQKQPEKQPPASESRKPRRRRTRVGGEGQEADTASEANKPTEQQGQQKKRSGQRSRKQAGQNQGKQSGQPQSSSQKPAPKQAPKPATGPRPGQKSSGLRSGGQSAGRQTSPPVGGQTGQATGRPANQSERKQAASPAERNTGQASGEGAHRKARRRTHRSGGSDASSANE